MNASKRRSDPRVDLQVPIRFRLITQPGSAEQEGESVNVSQRGVYMATSYPLQVGTQVELEMRMPKEFVGTVASEVRCTARVVHTQPNTFLGGKMGVGLHIERYEAPRKADRWTS